MKKKIVLTIIAVITIATIGGYFYINNIDWNKRKDLIANKFFEATGKKIVFSGPISLSLLPNPVIKASNVKIMNPSSLANEEPLMTIKSLNGDLEFGPLLNGQTNISLISLQEPTINVIKDSDGQYNWLKDIDENTINNFRNAQMVLNSMTIQDAILIYEDEFSGLKVVLEDLKSEIMAESLLGPFNFDGNFIKDNQPGGFSISLGLLSNRFATPLNFALSQPKSQSALRFDGSFLTENNSIKGDVVFSSKKLKTFIDGNFPEIELGEEYNYPLSLNFELNNSFEKIDISNFVFEYGKSKGAGSFEIPHNLDQNEDFVPTISSEINFTELDIYPLISFIKSTLKKEEFRPPLNFNLKNSFHAVKTTYKNQTFENLDFDLTMNQGYFDIKDFNTYLPEKSDFNAKGSFYANEYNILTYSFEAILKTPNLYHILSWFDIAPKREDEETYQKASIFAKIEGEPNQIKIFDIDASIDDTKILGSAGMSYGDKLNLLLSLDFDQVDLDYYLPKSNEDISFSKAIEKQILSLTSKNKINTTLSSNIEQLTFNNTLFNEVKINADAADNFININNLDAKVLTDTDLAFSGKIYNLENIINLENFKYKVDTLNVDDFLNLISIKSPLKKNKEIKTIEALGIISGEPNNFNTKSNGKLDDITYSYSGNIKNGEETTFNGNIKLASSNFLEFVNSLGLNYKPNVFTLGTMIVDANITGTKSNMTFSNTALTVGANTFKGGINFINGERPSISANLEIDKFETQRFFYNNVKNKQKATILPKNNQGIFMTKPSFNSSKIDYDFYKTFDLDANIKIDNFNVNSTLFQNASFNLNVKNNTISFSNISTDYSTGKILGDVKINLTNSPVINGNISLNNLQLPTSSNKTYGLEVASFDINNAKFSTSASSIRDAFENISSTFDIKLNELNIKGFDFDAITKSLSSRKNSDGLINEMIENLSTGNIFEPERVQTITIKDGEFNFDTTLNSSTAIIKTQTSGSLKNWAMDFSGVVELINNKELPTYSFSLIGEINEPKLSVNADNFVKLYKEQQNEIIRQAQLKEEQKKQDLKNKMNNVLTAAEENRSKLTSFVKDELTTKQATASSDDFVNSYNHIKEMAKETNFELDDVTLQASAIEFSNEDILELTEKNKLITKKISKLQEALPKIYIEDIKNKANIVFKKITPIKDKANIDYNNTLTEYENIIKKFSQIEDLYTVEDNKINMIDVYENNNNTIDYSLKNNVNNINEEINTITNDANKKNKTLEDINDVIKIGEITKELSSSLNMLNDLEEKQNIASKELILYITNKFKKENEMYLERKKQEEIKKEIIENTASISIEDKGSVTIKKGIAKVKEEETLNAEKNAIKVLDFSNGNNKNNSDSNESGKITIHK